MRQENDAAPIVPVVFAAELYYVALREIRDERRKVDIMRDQNGSNGRHLQDETLVAAAVAIIGKNPDDLTPPLDLQIARSIPVGLLDGGVATDRARRERLNQIRLRQCDIREGRDEREGEQSHLGAVVLESAVAGSSC
jgi:hypothetical protein